MTHRWLKRLSTSSQKTLVEAYQDAFHGTQGTLILKDLAAYCRFNETSFTAGDPYSTAFNEGARDAYLHILEMLHMDPQTLLQPYQSHDQ